MQKLQFLILLFVTLGFVQNARADSLSGNDLARNCSLISSEASQLSPSQKIEIVHCGGYFRGLGAGLMISQTYADMSGLDKWLICLPDGWTPMQLAKIALKYTQDQPEELHKSWRDIAIESIAEAFPCTNSQ